MADLWGEGELVIPQFCTLHRSVLCGGMSGAVCLNVSVNNELGLFCVGPTQYAISRMQIVDGGRLFHINCDETALQL